MITFVQIHIFHTLYSRENKTKTRIAVKIKRGEKIGKKKVNDKNKKQEKKLEVNRKEKKEILGEQDAYSMCSKTK